MAVAETLATNVQAAIGAKYPLSGSVFLYASFYGSLGAVDLSTHVLTFLGAGYTNPEDVAIFVSGSASTVYMTERTGTLLQINMSQPDRAHAAVVASGMTAPQQIALSADGKTAFIVEYNPAALARLLRFDLTKSPATMTVVRNDIQAGVGAIFDDATQAVYITEQAGTGTLTRIDTLATGAPRTLITGDLPAPFFLTWWDAGHSKLLVPLRDPYNRIVSVDLTATPAPVRRLLDGVPFRPSSVAVTPSGHLIVCSDREITDYDLSAGPTLAVSRGMGAGGSLYCPVVCPANPQELLISCDMTGLYRSTSQGKSWVLQDTRQVQAGTSVSAAYEPSASTHLVSTHPVHGLVSGTSSGNSVTWTPLAPPLAGVTGDQVLGLAFSPDGQSLIVATKGTLNRLDRVSPTWTSATTASVPGGGLVSIGNPIAVASPGPSAPPGWCFAADSDRVYWSDDHGATWWALIPTVGQKLPTPGRLAGLAAGTAVDATGAVVTVVYATTTTVDTSFTNAGVWRLQLSSSAAPSIPPGWANVSTGLTGALAPDGTWPRYDVLATPATAANTVYVGMPTGMSFGPPSWTIWQGKYSPATASMSWRGVLDGFTNQPGSDNVQAGWIDLAELNPADPRPQPALGFGFGGPPHGIACAQATSDMALQTSEAFADLTMSGALNSANAWQQAYTQPIQTFLGPRWRTTGLDVTNVWYYRVHPDPSKGSIHFLANTDIALSRSDDAGDTWQLIYPHRGGTFWGNFYELEFNRATGEIFAAVSAEHDLPYANQLDRELPPNTDAGSGGAVTYDNAGGGGTGRLIDTSKAWTVNQWVSTTVNGVVNVGAQKNTVLSNTATTLTMSAAWVSIPTGGSAYMIEMFPRSGAVLGSPDDGLTWSEVGTGLPDAPVLSVIYGGSPAALYAGVWRWGVYRLQASNVWQVVGSITPAPPAGSRRVRRIAFDGSGNLIGLVSGVDQGSGLYSWNGATWQPLTTSLLASFYPTGHFYPFDFVVDPRVASSFWLCTSSVSGGPDGAVYRTDNGGTSWTKVFTFASMGTTGPQYQGYLHCTAVAFDPNDVLGQTVYVTTETHGTWYSTDRGTTWQEFSAIPFLPTQRLEFDAHDPGTLYVATKGAGAWRTMTAAKAASLHQAIARRAYSIYLARGGAAGHAREDWATAEQQILGSAIRARAYELAQQRGFAPGHAVDDWLEATEEARRALLE